MKCRGTQKGWQRACVGASRQEAALCCANARGMMGMGVRWGRPKRARVQSVLTCKGQQRRKAERGVEVGRQSCKIQKGQPGKGAPGGPNVQRK